MSLLTAPEVAKLIGVDEEKLYGWRRRRVGPPNFRLMGRVVYFADELQAWIERQQEAAQPTA